MYLWPASLLIASERCVPEHQLHHHCPAPSSYLPVWSRRSASFWRWRHLWVVFFQLQFFHVCLSTLTTMSRSRSGWSADVVLSHHVQHLLLRDRQESTCWAVNSHPHQFQTIKYVNNDLSDRVCSVGRGPLSESVWPTLQLPCLWLTWSLIWMSLMPSLCTPQRLPGKEPVSVMPFILICFGGVCHQKKKNGKMTFHNFSSYSFGPSKWGPRIMPGHSRAGCAAKGDWWLGGVGGSLYWDASCDWNNSAHAVQLPAPLVGERTWELSRNGGQGLHWCHIRAPQSASGQHHENCCQQFRNWRSLLDEAVGRWAMLKTAVCKREVYFFSLAKLYYLFPFSVFTTHREQGKARNAKIPLHPNHGEAEEAYVKGSGWRRPFTDGGKDRGRWGRRHYSWWVCCSLQRLVCTLPSTHPVYRQQQVKSSIPTCCIYTVWPLKAMTSGINAEDSNITKTS